MMDRTRTRVVAPIGVIVTIGTQSVTCLTRNISLGGAFVVTTLPTTEGEQIKLQFIIKGQRFEILARVITVAHDGIGVQFNKQSPGFSDQIGSLISKILQETSESATLESEKESTTAKVGWSAIDQKSGFTAWFPWLHGRIHKAELTTISLDGAALICKRRAPVDDVIMFTLDRTAKKNDDLSSRAKVVRHTDHGFAISFKSPSVAFRRAVSAIRRGDHL